MKLEFGKFVREAICAVAAALAAECGAAGTATAEPGVSGYADAEASAWCALPPWKGGCVEELTITVEGVNTPTNEWEVWFSYGKNAEAGRFNYCIGFDGGRFFTSSYSLDYTPDPTENRYTGRFKFEMAIRLDGNDGCRVSRVTINGKREEYPYIRIRKDIMLRFAQMELWRSVRFVTRGCETPMQLTASNSTVGLTIRIVSADDAADRDAIAAVR